MKQKMNMYPVSMLLLLFCMAISSIGFGQKQGLLEVTQSYTLNSGGVTIKAMDGEVKYATYIKNQRTGKWELNQEATLVTKKEGPVSICADESKGQVIRIDVMAECPKCASVEVDEQLDCK